MASNYHALIGHNLRPSTFDLRPSTFSPRPKTQNLLTHNS